MNLFDVYPVYDLEPVKGEGPWVYDKEGNKYLDFYGGHAVISIGHCHPYYTEKIQEQAAKLGFYSNSIVNPLQKELAKKLGELCDYEEYSLFLSNSGAEANENAMKLASFHTGKSRFIAFEKGFHGRTTVGLSITDNPRISPPFVEKLGNTIIPLGDIELLEKELEANDVAGVVIEGIQGIAGIIEPGDDFLKQIRTLCDKYGVMLILDEIQSGYGRSGKFFAHQYSGVRPDLITVAKGMGNGFPIGGTLMRPIFEASYGLLGTTFGGSHLACAAGIAVLDVMKNENLIDNSAQMGEYLKAELKDLPGVKEITGKGLMIGLKMEFEVGELRKQLLFERKIFTGSSSDKTILRLLPPLNITKEHCDQVIQAIRSSVEAMAH